MKLRVLIVEDDVNFQKVVQIRLRAWKPELEINIANTLAAAKILLDKQENNFSFIILDQHLPDGLGVSILTHPKVENTAVLAVSADNAPELPANALRAGALHFLGKRQVSEPLFLPLVEALIERKKLEEELLNTKIRQSKMDSIRRLLATLRHEINNPLGAVLGGIYLLKIGSELDSEQEKALALIEDSGNRIKHVINQLCETADVDRELAEVTKGNEGLYQVPGDPKWE